MVVSNRETEKQEFAARLNRACDRIGVKQWGRAGWLAKQFSPHLSTQATQKWLSGLSIPDQTNIARLSKVLTVDASWLQSGPGLEVVPANNDEIAQKLAFIWRYLDDDDKKKILGFAQVAALPNKDDKPKLVFELPPVSDPATE